LNAARSTADGHLPDARKRLDYAISALIDRKPLAADNGRILWRDSLYSQLRAELPGNTGSGVGVPGSIPPVWVDGLALLTEIDRTTTKWSPAVRPGFIGPLRAGWCRLSDRDAHTVTRLRSLNERRWRPQDVSAIDAMSAQLERWAAKVYMKLSGEHAKYLPDACPACSARTVRREDDAGEWVRQPALKITTLGCVCQQCHHKWSPEYFGHLARVLGYKLPAGVLE
jgi:hypothetical protein